MGIDKSTVYQQYKSFAGTDALVFMLFPEASPICLGSITTVSYSIYRDTKPVPLMNRISVAGYTRGTRFVAGTAIFTLINKHWTKELLDQIPWLKAYGELKADELPIFDLMIVCANEYGAWTHMMIYGVWISDEGQVISIEDIFTENQFSFVARDIRTMDDNPNAFGSGNPTGNGPVTGTGPIVVNPGGNTGGGSSSGGGGGSSPGDRMLKLTSPQMQGADVKECQRLLNKHGASPKLDEDGYFGPNTRSAVTAFQSKHAIGIDGIVGPETWGWLRKDPCTRCNSSGSGGRRQLQLRSPMMTGEDVREAQNLLVAAGYGTGGVDGIFGPQTNTAVRSYQASRGLQVDGIIGPQTWDALLSKKAPVSTGSGNRPQLQKGSTGSYVKEAQTLLNSKIGARLTVDGIFGTNTYNAVRAFQGAQGIGVDGIIGPITWSRLLS